MKELVVYATSFDKISESGKVFAYEAPDGSVSKILDHNNEIMAKE